MALNPSNIISTSHFPWPGPDVQVNQLAKSEAIKLSKLLKTGMASAIIHATIHTPATIATQQLVVKTSRLCMRSVPRKIRTKTYLQATWPLTTPAITICVGEQIMLCKDQVVWVYSRQSNTVGDFAHNRTSRSQCWRCHVLACVAVDYNRRYYIEGEINALQKTQGLGVILGIFELRHETEKGNMSSCVC